MATIIICILLGTAVAAAVRYIHKTSKKGGCVGCSGCKSSCRHCHQEND